MVSKASLILSSVAILLLSSCASIIKAPAHLDAQAKEFKPDPSVSQVYLYRNETMGGAISMPVTVNGKLAGTTGPHSYFKFNLPAGSHSFASQGDGSELTIKTALGRLYYIWQEVKMGLLVAGSKLQQVDAAQGEKGVLESTMIDSPIGK